MAACKASKYRFLVGKEAQLRDCYQGIRIGRCGTDTNVIKVNTEFFAVPWVSDGTLAIVPLSAKGVAMAEEPPLLCNDRITILDFAWNPFNNRVMATSDQNGVGAIWNIPEGGLKSDLVSPSAQLLGHTKRLLTIGWHNRAENSLYSVDAGKVIKLWDISSGAGVEKATLDVAHKGLVTSVSWSYTGHAFCTSAKDKQLRIIDPRANKCVSEVADHTGAKAGRAAWLGKQDLIFTSGFTRTTTRELALWDPRNMKERLFTFSLDRPSTSTPLPIYDEDTSVVYICGKGDSSIMPFEVKDGKLLELTVCKTQNPQTGIDALPKNTCDVMNCEIGKFYKLTPKGQVIPMSFEIPRRHTGDFFQDDIFPPTWDGKPTASAAEFFGGAELKQPTTVSLDPNEK